ncbi:transcription factor cys6 [Trichoderma arundinaceum]|uniref:Transcription factor cys6 n=1 Tax=Trichoderma arundinaceum TaxID=490622 RepID=A0A395NZG3_TRIAR|nr:transcription factor cys6 [Trichoderma arundinaceum]
MENDSSVSGIQRRELSNKVYYYSRAHLLDEVCGPPDTSMASYSTTEGSAAKISLVMKILGMIANVDVQLNFCGYGGKLSEFCYEKDRMRYIQQMSSNYLELNHGNKYPSCELIYDIESLECSKVYHEQNKLYHRLNQLFWFGIGDIQSIEKDIESRENKYRSFFRIAHRDTVDDCSYSRLYFQIDAAVCEFYALRLYHFRCQGETLPDDKIRSWVTLYLQIAYRLQQIKVRYHWFDKSLFLVGAETHDAIYRDWIQRRMIRSDLKKALMCVWEKEKMQGKRLSREEYRAILRSASETYDAIPAIVDYV